MSAPAPRSTAQRPRNAFPANSRIPLDYCDGPTQRVYAASAFIALQSFKLYYWLGISRSDYAAEFFGFILWLSLDVAFLLALNYLRIPWLELPAVRLVLAVFALTIINYVLFTAREISPTAIARSSVSKVWGYIGSPFFSRGEDVGLRDQDEHLLGRHTVLIKPYSSALLNEEGQCFCVPSGTATSAINLPEIPILFNGSDPYYLEYAITSFETGKTSVHKLRGPFKESSTVLRKARMNQESEKSLYNLKASTSGSYKLQRIQDKDGVDIRFYHDREVYVVECPDARIDHHDDTLERCSGKGDADIPITVRGLPPWTVTYKRHANKKETQELVIESEPPGYSSPLLKGWSPPATPNYSWARQHEMNLSVSLGLSMPGEYGFQVIKVKDGCGNVIDIQGLVSRNLRKPEIRHVNVHERPLVSMMCDPRRPIKIVDMGESPSAPIDLWIKQGTAPFQVGYIYQKSDLDEPQIMKDVQITREEVVPRIVARQPGLYTLSHIKDAFCEGEIELPNDCAVTVATLPTLDVISHPINDSCVGAIGVTVDATFTGEGPWQVCFDVRRNGGTVERNVCHSSPKPRLNLELKPEVSGSFQYNFKTVSDKNYKNVRVDLPPIFQNIHPQPSAVFVGNRAGLKTCRGLSEQLDVELFGTGPWDIEYHITRGGDTKLFTERHISTNITTLTLPPFDLQGTYSVDLGKVTDLANGCQKDLKVPDVQIEVSNGPPTAAFQCDAPIEFPEGDSVDLPIHLTGGTPWYLTYGMEGAGSPVSNVSESRNAFVTVNKPGTYELHSVSDAFCQGEVVEQARKCEVIYSERPRMNLMIDSIRFQGGPRENVPEDEIAPSERISREDDYFVLPAVCKDADRTLVLRLTGKAPFELRYRRVYKPAKGGKEEIRHLSERSPHSTMRLPIMTDQAGTVSYIFDTLSDATYQDVEIFHDKHAVVFKHIVRGPPTATLLNTAKQFYCKNEITGAKEKIAIRIEDGVGPYSLAIEIMRPNQAVAEKLYEHDVVPRNGIYEWTLPAKFTDMGLYKVSVIRVMDTNSCASGATSTVEFDILDTPSITPLRSITDACVGDTIEFSVQGEAPPFKVFYSLDRTNHTTTLASKKRTFAYEATKSGLFRIAKVCQTLAKKECCTQPIEEMSINVWAVPTVKIADGTNVITDLREGDRAEVIATFEGVPPFSWSYVRTEAVYDKEHHAKHKKPSVLKKWTVEDIQEHKYTFFTATEGTIVPVWIKDKHCQFGKEV
ncbi:hypothetical protein B0O80DRAFT_500267 [Mortierella sp. GBAus27b]|nr:hypothetical protein BGX31_000461 [Mortierella sp. GBA43]KAI8351417.1 hypothetical protein B0O80DRAFT_500267 [Mortierella sp. GBAus27b]